MTADEARAMYRRQVETSGEVLVLQRTGAGGAAVETEVRGRVSGYAPDEIVGGIDQGDRKAIILAETTAGTAYPEPEVGDQLLFDGRTLDIRFLSARRVGGETIAYDLTVRGA